MTFNPFDILPSWHQKEIERITGTVTKRIKKSGVEPDKTNGRKKRTEKQIKPVQEPEIKPDNNQINLF